MSQKHVNVDVLIVGAGISGLMAARMLEDRGVSVCVLEKGENPGGRMATRHIGAGVADHGAQFFTVRDPEFQKWVDQWMDERIAFVWSYGFSDGSMLPPSGDDHPRYAVHGGINALPRHLMQSLGDVRLNTRIMTATCDEKGWILQDETGNLYLGKSLLMTAPVPLSLEILDEGATILTRDDHAALSRIEYAPGLMGIFWVEGRVTLPQPGAVQRRHANVNWIADNQQKGISPDATVLTVQASGQYSAQLWSAPDDRILNALRTDLQIYMSDKAVIREAQLKRWRYSRPLTIYEGRCMVVDNIPPLVFAGDAFGGPRVEGAALSGLAAGEALLRTTV